MEGARVRQARYHHRARARCHRVPRNPQVTLEGGRRDQQDRTVRFPSVLYPPIISSVFYTMHALIFFLARRTRHLPKPVYKAAQLKRTMLDAARVKEERRRKHTRAGESKPKAERKKIVIAEQS